MATYRGFDVLEVQPDAGAEETFERKVYVMDSATGARTGEAADDAPATIRDFVWLAFNRTEAKAIRDFVDARQGRAIPFWAPAWEQDFQLASDHANPVSALTVLSMGYTAQVFPAGKARRHLAVRLSSGMLYYREVTAAVDNGNGTETLTLDSSIAADIPVSALVTYLLLSRLEDDEVSISWVGHFAECAMRMRSLPRETP